MNADIKTCDQCKRFVRIRITCTNPLTIENYGIVTTQFGGKFCSSGCALVFLRSKKKKVGVLKKIKV
jgi:hypothetical protein